MNAAAYVGRVGGLAVALGVGLAAITGYGGAPAWADSPSSGSATNSTSSDGPADSDSVDAGVQADAEPDPTNENGTEPGAGDEKQTDAADVPPADETVIKNDAESQTGSGSGTDDEMEPAVGELKPEAVIEPDPVEGSTHTDTSTTESTEPEQTTAAITGVDANETPFDSDEQIGQKNADAVSLSSFAAPTVSTSTPEAAITNIAPPKIPSLRLWPTAFDPATAVTYVISIATSLVQAVLSPFAVGPPPLPVDATLWALLSWVRRELFNSTPTIVSSPQETTQTFEDGDVFITGNVGVVDADDDQLAYTVIGRPHNGGVVQVDADGNFIYRPMNAMAAVGGTDSFVVLVSDEAAGFHLHGPLGLLQFVPIVGNLLYPGGGHRVARTITVNVTPVDGIDLSLPDDFGWGVAYSGFQAEGGPGSPVDPNSDWYRWVHDPLNQQLGLVHGVPENGPGAYVNYDADAELASGELGMNTFRIGIEWSRIFPNSTAAVDISDDGGAVTLEDLQALDALANQDEVEHYRDVLASLRAHGLEPMVTVTHFSLPLWVHDPTKTRPFAQLGLPVDTAGWLSSSTPVEFQKYAAYLAWKYGDQVDTWATINEPFPPVLTQFLAIPGLVPSWPPGLIRPDLASTFLVNQAKAHVAAYDEIHRWDSTVATAGQSAASVGFTNNMVPARPADPTNPLDVQAADAWNRTFNVWFPNAVIDGWVDDNLDGTRTPDEVHPDFMNSVDFLGVQYYGSQPMQGIGLPIVPGIPFLQGIPVRCSADLQTCSDFNQPIDPGGFREVLEVAASYGVPLWVTENGIADDDDTKRPGYLATHIAVVQDMVAHGSDIRGYIYWSFVDNLEWSEGYHLQFGLYGSDPTTPELERTPKPDSIEVISGIAGANALPIHLLEKYLPSAV